MGGRETEARGRKGAGEGAGEAAEEAAAEPAAGVDRRTARPFRLPLDQSYQFPLLPRGRQQAEGPAKAARRSEG